MVHPWNTEKAFTSTLSANLLVLSGDKMNTNTFKDGREKNITGKRKNCCSFIQMKFAVPPTPHSQSVPILFLQVLLNLLWISRFLLGMEGPRR
jgi:hypothetical protein